MAATETVPQFQLSRKSPINRSGVLTLSGFGIRVRMQSGHLELEDGVGLVRRKIRLARVGHGLKRLCCIGSDGFVSLAALRWLADQDVAFTMLERGGKALLVTGPVRPSDAKLRRAQALAHSTGAALRISQELIRQKLVEQERVARLKLLDSKTADQIARFKEELAGADCISSIRLIESLAAHAYWRLWSALPINYPKSDLRKIPTHWLRFGARVSPLTGSPRLACNPPNAILNYLYSLLEVEARNSANAMGLDPGLGVLHADTTARDSLACDLMEPIRAQVDSYLLHLITRGHLSRRWFIEQPDGNCRLSAEFASQLAETAPTWGRAVAPVAEWVAHEFWKTIPTPDKPFTTRLTQNNKREAKGAESPRPNPAPRPEHICVGCGKAIERSHKWCAECAQKNMSASFIAGRQLGQVAAQSSTSKARRIETKRRHDDARRKWSPEDQPAWLTDEVYANQIQPQLVSATLSEIASAIGVSIPYASDIRRGRRRPHPRHWLALAAVA